MFPSATRFLIVDDMIFVRSTLKKQLQAMGFANFLEAGDGQKAWDVLNEQLLRKEPIDIILSDWNMPVLQGIELLRRVRAHDAFRELPFLLITAESEGAQIKEALELRVDGYLKKPFTADGLREHLGNLWKLRETLAHDGDLDEEELD